MELPENKLTDFIHGSQKAKWIPVNNHNVNHFTEDEIKRITNNYSTLIGEGGFGQVYQGSLDDGTTVAVKKYKFQGLKEGFAKEMIVHCQINHKNVVRLLGYCSEENAFMIVTEYVPGGNLKHLLHGTRAPISLDARLRIAIECAEALAYMHSSMYKRMIHGDIKPDNILLDNNLGAKLSDFGLSRLLSMDQTQYTVHIAGSIGYMDPVYLKTGRVDPKNDVYSFGVVLLELITRAKAIENGFGTDLDSKFTDALGKGKQEARKMFDTEIANERDIKTLDEIGNLAAQCLKGNIKERPEMEEVLGSLKMLRRSLCCEQAEEKTDQGSSRGTQAITQKVDDHGSSIIPSSSSVSSVIDKISILDIFSSIIFIFGSVLPIVAYNSIKLSILDIFNKKTRRFQSYCGPILKALKITVLTSKELKKITSNYSTLIRPSLFGNVYMGHIEGQAVAVELLIGQDVIYDKDDFVRAMVSAATICHMNIVKLLGCCLETETPQLVYEYASNGSLWDILHGCNGGRSLTPDLRLDIAIGSAQALGYLHSLQKIHGNVTSWNILLDHDFVPKVWGYFVNLKICNNSEGEFRPSIEITDMSYVDPVCMRTFRCTSKGDVYPFGIVLLELITRKPPRYGDNVSLPLEYTKACRDDENGGRAMFDREIVDEGNILILEEMGKVALECLREDADERPNMTEVVERLQNIRRDWKNAQWLL